MKKTSRETCLYPAGKDAPEAVVEKDHPGIEFRGRMDTLDAMFILAAAVARKEGEHALARDLIEPEVRPRRHRRARLGAAA